MSRGAAEDGGSDGRLSVLAYALLGLLAREDLSGYDLAARMKGRIGFFWSARHSQIYPELARLEAVGLVTHTVVLQSDRPDKKVYAVTAAGREALADWLTSPFRPAPNRDELTLRAYSIWLADPARAAALFRHQERRHAEQLAEYEAIETQLVGWFGDELWRPVSPAFATFAALRRGIGHERAYVEWCAWLAERLESADGTSGDAGAAEPS